MRDNQISSGILICFPPLSFLVVFFNCGDFKKILLSFKHCSKTSILVKMFPDWLFNIERIIKTYFKQKFQKWKGVTLCSRTTFFKRISNLQFVLLNGWITLVALVSRLLTDKDWEASKIDNVRIKVSPSSVGHMTYIHQIFPKGWISESKGCCHIGSSDACQNVGTRWSVPKAASSFLSESPFPRQPADVKQAAGRGGGERR